MLSLFLSPEEPLLSLVMVILLLLVDKFDYEYSNFNKLANTNIVIFGGRGNLNKLFGELHILDTVNFMW